MISDQYATVKMYSDNILSSRNDEKNIIIINTTNFCSYFC